MYTSATNSSLDVAYWFINRAEKDNLYLETDKLQCLLFVSQQRYAQQQNHPMLMPCLFSCDDKGFFEPTLRRFFAQGRPYMPAIKLSDSVSLFLERVWSEFCKLSISDCRKMVISSSLYETSYQKGCISVIPFDLMTKKETLAPRQTAPYRNKVLLSQNGPVIVSRWTPRKINI